jgi:DNA-binding MarR family transcriptional regulator
MKPTDEMPAYAIGPLLQRAQRHAADTFNSALTSVGIEGRHFGILMTLDRLGPLSQARLAQHLGTDKSAMVRLIDDLEMRGYVERRDDPGDRRAVAVTVTASGTEAFNQAKVIAQATAEELLNGFTGKERRQFQLLLATFVGIRPTGSVPLPGPGRE